MINLIELNAYERNTRLFERYIYEVEMNGWLFVKLDI